MVLLTIVATAQNKPLNTIYFKNGSVIKGSILQYQVDGSIKIETADKSVWVFKSADVDKIEIPKPVKTFSEVDYSYKKGTFTQLQVELMPSKKESTEGTVPAMLGVVGYQLNKHFSAGVGTGVEAFHVSMLPLFGDFRYYFLNDRFTPFINLKGGYAFPLENQKDVNRNVDLKSYGGLMGGIEFGYVKTLSNSTKFTFSLGYRYQRVVQTGIMTEYNYTPVILPNGTTYTYNADRKVVSDYNRIVITFGFRFW
jgi:sRNA-binding regulator protein Hfq